MKRSVNFVAGAEDAAAAVLKKKTKMDGDDAVAVGVDKVLSDDNLVYEILKRVDGRTLATAGCVCRQWNKTAVDERLWELICTEHYSKIPLQLRTVVLALGGFRRLFSLYLWPLLKPPAVPSPPVSSGGSWQCVAPAKGSGNGMKKRWGKDEINLSLSLLSIRYYERMNFSTRPK